MARVELTNLIKVYPERNAPGVRAVDDVTLSVEDREFMVLVGPSGCGKTTTLRMIAGLEQADSGTIAIGGNIVNDLPPKDRDIAMVFQNYALYPHMSVYDNMAFGLKLRKFARAEIDRRVREAASVLGLEDLLHRRPVALSGGQRQRVAVGRAIVRKPKVFLFDEPLSNLDAQMRVIMRTEISKLHARLAATMIYVTHDQVEAMTMGDRITVMKEGRIQQVAEPLDLYHRPENVFVAGFIGSPPMNFLRGTLRRAGSTVRFEEENNHGAALSLALPDTLAARAAAFLEKSIVLGIRPEHLSDGLPPPSPDRVAEVSVEVSEPMGHETYVYLTTGAHALVARLPGNSRFRPQTRIRVDFDLEHAHLFNPQDGRVLT